MSLCVCFFFLIYIFSVRMILFLILIINCIKKIHSFFKFYYLSSKFSLYSFFFSIPLKDTATNTITTDYAANI